MADSEDTAILEVSSENKTSISLKNDSRDSITDVSNYSTSVDGSVVQSLSVESFSIVAEQDIFESPDDVRDLQVRVDNPQKHLDPFETYISFRVTTRTSREEFLETEYIVRRRYSDFLWLRQKLVDAYPTHLVPPLPGKHTLLGQLDRYSREFIVSRMSMLNRFLNRVVNHPILSYHQSLQIFLTAKSSEFSIHRRNSVGLLGRMTGSLQQLTSVYMCRQREPEFEVVKEYVSTLCDKLTTLQKIGDRICKERKEHVLELHQFHPVFRMWAGIEPQLETLLLQLSVAIEKCATAQQTKLIDTFLTNFSQPLKEYLLYVDAIKEVLSRRDSIQIDFEVAVDEMSKKKAEKDQLMFSDPDSGTATGFNLWKSPAEIREDKLEKLSLAIPRLVKLVETNQDKMEIANEDLRADMERWRAEKKQDLKKLLMKMADQHIQYYQECLDAWEVVLLTLKGMNNNSTNNRTPIS